MNKMPQSFKIRVNRSPVSAEFLPRADDQEKAGSALAGPTTPPPTPPSTPRLRHPQGSRSALASSPDTNTGPYGSGDSTNYGPYGGADGTNYSVPTAAIADRSAWATSQKTLPDLGLPPTGA